MESLIETVGSGDFPRLRFGVGRPEPAGREAVDFVLEPFGEADLAHLPEHIECAALALEYFLEAGIVAAMDRFNAAEF